MFLNFFNQLYFYFWYVGQKWLNFKDSVLEYHTECMLSSGIIHPSVIFERVSSEFVVIATLILPAHVTVVHRP